MTAIANALADPVGRSLYLAFCFGLLVVPMIVLGLWYRARVKRLPFGKAVLREQARIGVRTGRLWQAISFGRDIGAGRYGADIRQLQDTIYVLAAVWAAINVVAFAILIWADEVNRP